jgi:hypothetical protein
MKPRVKVAALIAIVIALLSHTIAVEILPTVEMSAAVFQGEVLSNNMLHTSTNSRMVSVLYASDIRVTKAFKQDAALGKEVTIYYRDYPWVVCPRSPSLRQGDAGTFYCTRATIPDLMIPRSNQVLYLPSASWFKPPSKAE